MARLRVTFAARHDLRSIHRHSEAMFGLGQADIYASGLAKAIRLIADYPGAARLRTDMTPPVRVSPYRSHVILYAFEDDEVLILRVRHAGEDWLGDSQSSSFEDDL